MTYDSFTLSNDYAILKNLYEFNSNFKLNLKSFRLKLNFIGYRHVLATLFCFLETQTNLEDLELIVGHEFCDLVAMLRIYLHLKCFPKLKELHIGIVHSSYEFGNSDPFYPWDLTKDLIHLEKLTVWFEQSNANTRIFAAEVLVNGSQNLKVLDLSGKINLGLLEFEDVLMKFPNLIDLKIGKDCIGHSSNDIIGVYFHLKKLRTLHFEFPDELDETDLNYNEDMWVLPEIQDVKFTFNGTFENDTITMLLKHIRNASIFTLDWADVDKETQNIITEELPNLIQLKYVVHDENDSNVKNLVESKALKVKTSIEKYVEDTRYRWCF